MIVIFSTDFGISSLCMFSVWIFLTWWNESESESAVTQSCPTFGGPMDCTCQAPPSMGFSRQKYWCGLPFPFPANLMKWILIISLTFQRGKFRHKKSQLSKVTQLVRGKTGFKHKQPISRVHMIAYGERYQIRDLQRRKFSLGTRDQAWSLKNFCVAEFY